MQIDKVSLTGFRNIKRADLETGSPFVVIGGHNAAGKTSVLEAIYLALAGRSFRTREWTKLINYESSEAVVTVVIGDNFVGASRSKGRKPQHRLNGDQVSLSRVAKTFPIQLFDTGLFEIFEGSPSYRRQLIDWALFHVKPAFYSVWKSYHQALKQRNGLLKEGGLASTMLSELDSWDRELIKYGELLSEYRALYTQELLVRCSGNSLLEGIDLKIDYFSGWPKSTGSLAESLNASRQRDIKYKRTTVGPHQSDLKITANTKKAGDSLSRGQKKLAGFAIKLEQVKMYNAQSDSTCLILCDDFAAELDIDNQKKILNYIADLKSQVFMTVIETNTLLSIIPNPEKAKVFHVKQGLFKGVEI